jgi:SagB-type dehydrogenase family enzyme
MLRFLPTQRKRKILHAPRDMMAARPSHGEARRLTIDALDRVLWYHERTKHHPHRFAPSPGYLDWATQPDPFRAFAGAPLVELPLVADPLDTSYDDLYLPRAVTPREVRLETVAFLFELALGLSAWKEFRGERWALRCNPSSGNLHPTEGYAIVPDTPGMGAGLYHYVSRAHVLEARSMLAGPAAARLGVLLGPGLLLVGLSSVHWREAWKYGERAWRYCQHDAGHAMATVRYAAAVLGWSARLLAPLSDDDVAAVLGLDRDEDFATVDPADREQPDGLLVVGPPAGIERAAERVASSVAELMVLVRGGAWAGDANALSSSHREWPAIDEVTRAAAKPRTHETDSRTALVAADAPSLQAASVTDGPPPVGLRSLPDPRPSSRQPASTLIRQRRSAVAMDGITSIDAEAFYTMLDRLLPRPATPPWDVLPWPPRVHGALFVHRVTGLASGLYAFERDPGVLRAALGAGFRWERPDGCPSHLPLFLLLPADCRNASAVVSCNQDIAADGAFSLAMLADFRRSLAEGPWWYRRLHWEAGVLGQVLYLEAEAAGVRSTGMGCYFDDDAHELLGIGSDRFQDLYHFTVGGPVDDPRLSTLPPYAHLGGGRAMARTLRGP